MLKEILGEDIRESQEEFHEWLSALSKEQLIAEMLRKKESGAWKSDDEIESDSKKGDKAAAGDTGINGDWGGDTGGGETAAPANGGSWE